MSNNKKLLKNYSGIFGSMLLMKSRKGGKVAVWMPTVRPKVKPSEKQIAARDRFKKAAVYARDAMKDPELLAKYSVKATRSVPAYQLAVNDFLRKPKRG